MIDARGTYSVSFELDELPKTQPDTFPNRFARSSYRKKWHRWVWLMVLKAGGPPDVPLERAVVTCVRHSAGRPDADNLRYSFKAVLDGLVKCGVLKDDRPAVIGEPEVSWRRTQPKQGHITVAVREVL